MEKILARSLKETEAAARQLAASLRGGEIIALTGNLGAGKTVFVRALAQALGVEENITSPTFVLLKTYDTKQGTFSRLVHVDCYRLEGEEDLADIGLHDYLSQPDTVAVIEWADKIRNLPAGTIRVQMDYVDNDSRQITIDR